MATLYEIDNAILECIDMETGEIIDLDKLNSLEIQREQKLENIALYIKNLKSDVEEFKKEKENFVKKQQAAENKIKYLTDYLSLALKGEKFKTPRVSVSYRNSQRVVIIDDGIIPEEFKKYDVKIDKLKIKGLLKEGKSVAGCCLDTATSTIIK